MTAVRDGASEPGKPPGPVLRSKSPATGAESIGRAADGAAAGDSALLRRNQPPPLAACAPPLAWHGLIQPR